MNESLMGGYSGNPTWSEYALDDLQSHVNDRNTEEGDPAVPAETAEDMFADLQSHVNDGNTEQGDFAALAEKIEGMFADPEVIKKAALVGYHLGVRAHRELGDGAANVDPETVARMLKDLLLEVQDAVLRLASQDELNQPNDRVVRRGEQPGKA